MTRWSAQVDGRFRGRGLGARRRGLSLVEAVVSMVIVSVMIVAALQSVALAKRSELLAGRRSIGLGLAQSLMSEALSAKYADPDGITETASTSERTAFDDLSDYDGWTHQPPVAKDGTEIPDLAEWSRSVSVAYINPLDLTTVVTYDSGLKRVIVTAHCDGAEAASLTAYRSFVPDSWEYADD